MVDLPRGAFLLAFLLTLSAARPQPQVDSLLQRLTLATNDTARLKAHLALYLSYERSDAVKSLHHAERYKALATRLGEVKASVEAENMIGSAYFSLSMYPAALAHFQRYIALSDSAGLERRIASAWTNIALIHEELGDYDEAIAGHLRSLEIKERFRDPKGMSHSYHNLGYVYNAMGDADKAMEHFVRGLGIRRAMGDTSGIMSSMTRVAMMHLELGDHAKALGILDTCMAMALAVGDDERQANVLGLEADILLEQGRADEAWARMLQAAALNAAAGRKSNLCSDLLMLGEMASDRGRTEVALEQYREALRAAEETGSLSLRTKVLKRMVEALRAAHRYEEAFRYMDRHEVSKDSLLASTNGKEVTRMSLEQDFKVTQFADSLRHASALAQVESERALAQVRADRNRDRAFGLGGGAVLLLLVGATFFHGDRKRRQARFEKEAATLETQALRSQMNPHFIFNALNSISTFVQKNEPDKAVGYLSRFARLMRLVLENSRQAEVPLQDDLEALDAYMMLERIRGGEKFDYTITVAPDIDPQTIMVPPLVMQPFVENAIWHGMSGKEGKGHITLKVTRRTSQLAGMGEELVMSIEDDGVGRLAPKQQPEGVPIKKSSLATAITKARLDLVQKQKGRPAGFKYIDLPQGTRVEVSLPVSEAD